MDYSIFDSLLFRELSIDNKRILLVQCTCDVFIRSQTLITIFTIFYTAHVYISEIRRGRSLKQSPKHFVTFFLVSFFEFFLSQ